jgi:hypothetical protein
MVQCRIPDPQAPVEAATEAHLSQETLLAILHGETVKLLDKLLCADYRFLYSPDST